MGQCCYSPCGGEGTLMYQVYGQGAGYSFLNRWVLDGGSDSVCMYGVHNRLEAGARSAADGSRDSRSSSRADSGSAIDTCTMRP